MERAEKVKPVKNKSNICDLLMGQGFLTSKQIEYANRIKAKMGPRQPLGDTLVRLEMIPKNAYLELTTAFKTELGLGEYLYESGLLNYEQLRVAIDFQKENKGASFAAALIESGVVSKSDLIKMISGQDEVVNVELDATSLSRPLIEQLSVEYCIENCVIPLSFEEGLIKVAVCEAPGMMVIDKIERTYERPISFVVSSAEHIKRVLNKYAEIKKRGDEREVKERDAQKAGENESIKKEGDIETFTMICPNCKSRQTAPAAIFHASVTVELACGACLAPLNLEKARKSSGEKENNPPKRTKVLKSDEESAIINAIKERLQDENAELPTIPEVSMEIVHASQDPDFSINDYTEMIRKDSVIAGKVVSLANSSYYSGLKQINELPKAIMRIGSNNVRNVALAVGLKNLYKSSGSKYSGYLARLWKHSISSAVVCRELANARKFINTEEAFLSGLTKDIGKVLIVTTLDDMSKTDGRIANLSSNVYNQVQSLLHEALGAYILKKWNFPDEIVTAVRYHHNPPKAEGVEELAWMLAGSDVIGKSLGLDGAPPDARIDVPTSAPLKALGLDEFAIAKLLVDIEDKADEMRLIVD